MVSIRDISDYCGVSIATVSKALNGRTDVSEATRQKVLAAAEELGYFPNATARALRLNRTYNLGVLFEDAQHAGLNHEYFSAILEGFRSKAEQEGYDVTFINRNVGENKHSGYLEHCRYRGVDGVCIVCVDYLDPKVAQLVEGELPLVTIDHSFENHMAVLSNNRQGVEALVQYACSLGHRNFAFIHGERLAVTERRLRGFYRACRANGITVETDNVIQAAYNDPIGCEKITAQLLERENRPTCILFPDDIAALGGIAAIGKAGLRIPEDISVMGYDGNRLSPHLVPPLTTYHQDTRSLGETAAGRLIDLIEKPKETTPQVVEVAGWLMTGGSVAAVE